MHDPHWQIGTGKGDVTVYEPGMAMFGWGQPHNVARSVAMPLLARAVAVADGDGPPVVLVNCDLGMVSQALRQAVDDRLPGLGLDPERVLVAATHTHSGPNGYSDHLFYAVTGPGFSQRVHDGLASGILDAIGQAVRSLRPGRGRVATRALPVGLGIAFNRSVRAHRRNPGVAPDVDPAAALDRRLVVLRLEEPDGRLRATVSWFPLHGTCLHADNTAIHPDHPGVTAERLERWAAEQGASTDHVALVCQEAAGDSSPNSVRDPLRGVLAGAAHDLAHVEQVGEALARQVALACEAARGAPALSGPVAARVAYRDFARAEVDPAHAGGRTGLATAPAELGLAFALGTDEGPGPLYRLSAVPKALAALRRRVAGDPRVPGWELGRGVRGRVLGRLPPDVPGLGRVPDPRVRWYLRALRSGVLGERSWVPQVLPGQVMRLGSLVVAALPSEPTTVAGRRIRRAVARGDEVVVVQGYANAYAGYVVTPEEYDEQHYEAASTLFGRWTLPAWCTLLSDVRDALDAGRALTGPAPPRYTRARLPPMDGSWRAPTRLRWPMLFRLEPADATLLDRARRGFEVSRDYDASPDVVHRSFLAFVGDTPWSPGFCGVDWWTPREELDGAVIDELYAFMAMRVRVVEHVPGRRSSLPLARRMVQRVETFRLPDGRTRLSYRVAYDPPAVFAPLAPPIERVFSWWFRVSLEGLERMLAAGGGAKERQESSTHASA
jgi:neutral ceramidase